MNKKYKVGLVGAAVVAIIAALAVYLHHHTVDVLQPAGQVGYKERQLMIFAVLLSVIVVVPVFSLTIFIAWKYREGNSRPKKYSPDWDHSRLFESIWWGIPIAIIAILSVVTWRSSHALDPYRALVSTKRPLTVQVVALDWKWLFIYPEQHVASVNLAEIPVGTPVDFQITSDTVMNSFWVPQLGGQIYAMPGMITQLNLVADKAGTYAGSSANISGSGFAGMSFHVAAGSPNNFDDWVARAQRTKRPLNSAAYNQLAKPSKYVPVSYYSSVQSNLFNYIAVKYMTPLTAPPATSTSVSSHSVSGSKTAPLTTAGAKP
ncbi:MAG TPA: ubiquinol oxidase subunit II [Candidatus Saccharimonadales bacterium]|nr:ubiquinol oxidase subunit II [Candidatus Saccharimonadales bacterium]